MRYSICGYSQYAFSLPLHKLHFDVFFFLKRSCVLKTIAEGLKNNTCISSIVCAVEVESTMRQTATLRLILKRFKMLWTTPRTKFEVLGHAFLQHTDHLLYIARRETPSNILALYIESWHEHLIVNEKEIRHVHSVLRYGQSSVFMSQYV